MRLGGQIGEQSYKLFIPFGPNENPVTTIKPDIAPQTPMNIAAAPRASNGPKTKAARVATVSRAAPTKNTAANKLAATKLPATRHAAKKLPAVPVAALAGKAAPTSTEPAPGRNRHKLVRDSFTIPKSEYAVLAGLKVRASNLKHPTKKSELLRAGIAALQSMSDKAFLCALGGVPSLKTGRPKSATRAVKTVTK